MIGTPIAVGVCGAANAGSSVSLTGPSASIARAVGATLTLSASYSLGSGETFTRIDWVANPGGGETVIATDNSAPLTQPYALDGVELAAGEHTLVARLVTNLSSHDSPPITLTIYSAITDGAALASGSEWTSGTTWNALTTSIQLDAGDFAVVIMALDNVATTDGASTNVTSVTFGGVAVTKVCEYTGSNGVAGDGVTLWVGVLRHGSNIASGASIVVTLSNAVVAKTLVARQYNADSAAGSIEADGTIQTELTDGGADPGALSVTADTDDNHLFFRAVARGRASNPILTATVGWSTTTFATSGASPAADHVGVRGEFLIDDGTASGTSDPTASSTSGIHVSALIPFRQAA